MSKMRNEEGTKNFIRGEIASVSVRMKKKKNSISATVEKKRNRHSGDFGGYFSKVLTKDKDKDEDDWSYITFPNSDQQQDVIKRTTSNSGNGKTTPPEEPNRTPVKVITNQVPGLKITEEIFRRKTPASKNCSDEFEFKRSNYNISNINNNNKEKSDFERKFSELGLGRRSVTQITIQRKKNSYNSAMCKSQENLVKAMINEDNVLEKEKLALKKGLLWQQRDKLFSRWKERYFILTPDYLHCFRKESSSSISTILGGFIFKIRHSDVEDVELLDKRGYLTICISLQREGKVYLRKTEGIREWFNVLKKCVADSKKAKTKEISNGTKKLISDLPDLQTAAVPCVSKEEGVEITLEELNNLYKNEEKKENRRHSVAKIEHDDHHRIKKHNRLSLAADIELPDFIGQDFGIIDLEKGGNFLRNKKKNHLLTDTESNDDSGNNSINTNGSVGSSSSSHSTSRDDRQHFDNNNEQAQLKKRRHRRSGLQITPV